MEGRHVLPCTSVCSGWPPAKTTQAIDQQVRGQPFWVSLIQTEQAVELFELRGKNSKNVGS